MSHDFLDKSTNNHNVINEGKGEAMELESVNDFLISSENDTQAIVKEKRGGSNRCENDIPNNSAAHRKICTLHTENVPVMSKTINDAVSIGYNIFLIPFDEKLQDEIDKILTYDPANIPRCYETMCDVAAALRKFGRVLGKDITEDMSNYELMFVIWHGLYSECIIQQDQQR